MILNKYYYINYEMYFHNKLIWSHKCEYYLLKTWSNVKHLNYHVYHCCILLGTEVYGWAKRRLQGTV